jgi:hypothetical protein
MSTYTQIRDAKNNPSPRTLSYFKRHPHTRIWAMGKKDMTLTQLKKMGLRAQLWLGRPDFSGELYKKYEGKSTGRSRAFSGCRMSDVTYDHRSGRHGYHGHYVGLGNKGKGLWMIDVTNLFIELYNKYGMCAMHDERHEFVIKKKYKECKFCGTVYSKQEKKVVKTEIIWTKQLLTDPKCKHLYIRK